MVHNFYFLIYVSSREFREKQAEYMDRADNGEQIIVQRGKNKAYAITPIANDDLYFTPQVLKRIKESIQQAKEGKVVKIGVNDDIQSFFDAL